MILHWNYRNLSSIPEELLQNGAHIQEIYLKRNCLTSLPKDIGKLKNLTNLYLIGNSITIIPSEIEQLEHLRFLDLSGNLLQYIPTSIGNMRKLEHLILTQNYISYLPKELGRLKSLKFLELSGNKLYHLPEEAIRGLESIEEIAIDGNPITHFPRSIVSLKKLRYVSACRCHLLFLPSMPFHYLVNWKKVSGGFTPKNAVPEFSEDAGRLNDFQLLIDSNYTLNYLPYWLIQLLDWPLDIYGCGISPKKVPKLSNPESNNITRSIKTRGLKLSLVIRGVPEHTLYFDEDLVKIHNETTIGPLSLLETCLRVVYTENLHKAAYHQTKSDPVMREPLLKYSLRSKTKENNTMTSSDSLYEEMEINGIEKPQPGPKDISPHVFLPPLLPRNLKEILNKGVVSLCFMCLKPIFTETWLVVFGVPKTESGQQQNQNENLQPEGPEIALPNLENANESELIISCIYLCSKKCHSQVFQSVADSKCNLKHKHYLNLHNEIKFETVTIV